MLIWPEVYARSKSSRKSGINSWSTTNRRSWVALKLTLTIDRNFSWRASTGFWRYWRCEGSHVANNNLKRDSRWNRKLLINNRNKRKSNRSQSNKKYSCKALQSPKHKINSRGAEDLSLKRNLRVKGGTTAGALDSLMWTRSLTSRSMEFTTLILWTCKGKAWSKHR